MFLCVCACVVYSAHTRITLSYRPVLCTAHMYTYSTLILPPATHFNTLPHTATHTPRLICFKECTYSHAYAHTRTPGTHGSQHTRTPMHIPAQLRTYSHTYEHSRTLVRIPAQLCKYSHPVHVPAHVCTYPHTCARTRYTFGHTRTPQTRSCQHTRTPVHIPSQLCTYAHTFGHTRSLVHILAHLGCVALKRETPTTTYK